MLIFSLSLQYLFGLLIWLAALAWMLRWGLRIRQRSKLNQSGTVRSHWILSIWFFLFGLTLPELGSALFVDQSDAFNTTNISQRWFQNHVRLNPQGFRDELPFTRFIPAGRRRIVFLGDSFTFGHGIPEVQDRFSDRVGRSLDEQAAGAFQVANMGVPGHGVNDIRPIWKKFVVADDAQVDLAVYSLCLNDIEWFSGDNLQENEKILQLKPQFWLFRDTYFYNSLYFRVQLLQQPQLRNYYDYVRTYYNGTPWDRMREELDAAHQLIRQSGTEFRLVVFPFLHNLGPSYPFREAHRKIVDFAKSRKIAVLDLEPILARHAREGLVVNRFDPHPNERAHALAAEAILQELLSDLLQPLAQKTRKL